MLEIEAATQELGRIDSKQEKAAREKCEKLATDFEIRNRPKMKDRLKQSSLWISYLCGNGANWNSKEIFIKASRLKGVERSWEEGECYKVDGVRIEA